MCPQIGFLIFKMQNISNSYHEEVNQTTQKYSSEGRQAEKEGKGRAERGERKKEKR